jgi:Outer membrane protein beta-barrel domain
MKNHIKPLFTLIILAIILTLSAHSQTTRLPLVGIRGGANFSNLYTSGAQETKSLTGFNVGLFSKIPITGMLAIEPEIYFTTKGATITYDNFFVNGSATFKLNYVELPLLMVLNLTDNFNIHAGPYVGYLVTGSVKNKANIDLFNFEDNITADDFNRIEAGVAAGAGFDFGAVSIGIRYSYGLTKVGKEKTFLGTTYTFPDAKNSVLSLYASIPLFKN